MLLTTFEHIGIEQREIHYGNSFVDGSIIYIFLLNLASYPSVRDIV